MVSIPPIPGLADHLRTMLGNLLQNARESLPHGPGTVEVSTYIDPRDWLVVAIRDTGCGMSPDVLKRATEPFFSTKPDRDGVGPDHCTGNLATASRCAVDRQPPRPGNDDPTFDWAAAEISACEPNSVRRVLRNDASKNAWLSSELIYKANACALALCYRTGD